MQSQTFVKWNEISTHECLRNLVCLFITLYTLIALNKLRFKNLPAELTLSSKLCQVICPLSRNQQIKQLSCEGLGGLLKNICEQTSS